MPTDLCPASTRPVVETVAAEWPGPLRVLLGPDASEMLDGLVDAMGGRLGEAVARQVTYRPHRSTTVKYDVGVVWPDGRRTWEGVVAMAGSSLPAGATIMERGPTQVAVWAFPNDPLLPGLTAALDPSAVQRLFERLGLGREAVTLRVRAYRPGRRAVVEATSGQRRLFLKVVRPTKVEALHSLHRRLSVDLPVPDSLGWSDDGIVVMPALAGATLRESIRAGVDPLPEPASIDRLLDRLPADLSSAPPRARWFDAAVHHAEVIRTTVPGVTADVDRVVDRLAELDRGIDAGELVPIHGDLYESQLIVNGGIVTGLLDVDTAGSGQRVDDHANFCAHLSVLATTVTPSANIRRFGTRLLAHAETLAERREVRARIAASTLCLATGSFRVLERDWETNTRRRLALADQWIESAAR